MYMLICLNDLLESQPMGHIQEQAKPDHDRPTQACVNTMLSRILVKGLMVQEYQVEMVHHLYSTLSLATCFRDRDMGRRQ